MSKILVMTACALTASGLALAKLPPLDDAAKAKAAETAARAAWQAKINAFQQCKVQDRIAAQYGAKGGMVRTAAAGSAMNSPSSAATGGAGGSASAAPSTAAAAAAITAAAAPQAAGAAAMAAPAGVSPASPSVTPPHPPGAPVGIAGQAGGTPVTTVAAAPTIPPCTEPGPFAYNPPSQTPLETSGAHSPAGTAVQPPSVLPNSAQMAPAQAATPQSKKP